MIVTFITTKPASLTSGSEVRNYHLLKALLDSKEVSRVNLFYFKISKESELEVISDKKLIVKEFDLSERSIFKSLVSYFRGKIPYVENLKNNQFANDIYDIVAKSDVVLLSELDGYFAISKLIDKRKLKSKVFLDCHNIDSIRLASELESSFFLKKILGRPLKKRLRNEEFDALKRVDFVLCCSEVDKNYFNKKIYSNRIFVIPNGVSVRKLDKVALTNNSSTVVFMGLLSYPPNNDAIKYYLDDIHSLIREKVPNLKVIIIGKNAPKWLIDREKKDSSIYLKGFVDDPHKYLVESTLCICPLRFGSGTRLKILEYMSAGKAIVSTSIGAEGIEVTDNVNIMLANNAKEFSDEVVLVLKNFKKRNQLGKMAHELVLKRYSWELICSYFLKVLKVKE